MAFALNKSGAKKSPLAGWLGKKQQADSDIEVTDTEVAASLNRALRGPKPVADNPKKEKQNPVREALTAIESVLFAIDRIRDILEQTCDIVVSAKSTDDVGGRALLAESYDELRLSINHALEKIDPRAAGLIGKNQRHIDVALGDKTRYSVSPMRLDISDKGLNLSPPRDAFAAPEEIDAILEQLDNALARADRAAANYCRDAQYLLARMRAAQLTAD